MLHDRGKVEAGGITVIFAYPVLPWIGTMALGYCFGTFYGKGSAPEVRQRLLVRLGLACVLLFVVLRVMNDYGDPKPWAVQASPIFTVLSLLNVQKYPPSLLFCMWAFYLFGADRVLVS